MPVEVRVAGIVRRRNKILFALHRKGGREYWVLPGGRVKKGETLDAALEREMKEETGLAVKADVLFFINDFILPEAKRHVLNIYFTARLKGKAKPTRTPVERILRKTAFLNRREIEKVPIRPEIRRELVGYLDGKRPNNPYLGKR